MTWRARLLRWLPAALLLLFTVRQWSALRADGTCADERWHLAYGERGLHEHTFARPAELWNSKMPVSMLNALGAADLPPEAPWSDRLRHARLPTVVLAVALGVLVWRWAASLFGAAGGGLALFLYTFCPNFLAHGHLVTTDVATTLAMFGAILAWRHYRQRPTARNVVLAGAALGIAQLTKATALFLLPMIAVLAGLEAWRARGERRSAAERRAALRRLVLHAVVGAAMALFVLNAGFLFEGTGAALREQTPVSAPLRALAGVPLVRALPLPLPRAYVQGLDMVARDAHQTSWSYLGGEWSDHGFRAYFLVAALVKVPLGSWILLLLGTAWCVRRLPRAELAPLCIPIAVLGVYLSFLFRLGVGLRYALPALPFAFVLAGGAVSWAADAGRRRSAMVAVGLLGAWVAVSSALIHPHYLAYFNELAGGPDEGWRIVSDSNLDWGQDAERAQAELVAASDVPVFVDPPGPLVGRVAIGMTALVGLDPRQAARHAWLRDNFAPIRTLGHSWRLYDVGEAALDRCCRGLPRVPLVDDAAADLALRGVPIVGAEGVDVRFGQRLNDGTLGLGDEVDAARTAPASPRPVSATFGVRWETPRRVSRVVAYLGDAATGTPALRFVASSYVLEAWDGAAWRAIAGSDVADNGSPRIEHRFASVTTTAVRLLVRAERNGAGREVGGGFRAACREIGVYER